MELARDSANQEKDARKLFESGAQHPATLVDVMKKVNAEGELALYYDGGVRVLADLLQGGERQSKKSRRKGTPLKVLFPSCGCHIEAIDFWNSHRLY